MSDPSMRRIETDPNGLSANTPGAKLDLGKEPVLTGFIRYFPRAILAVTRLSEKGAKKYTWNGWRSVSDGPNRYGNAMARHLVYEAIEGEIDSGWGDDEILHATADAWNAFARLELILEEKENAKPTTERKFNPRSPFDP